MLFNQHRSQSTDNVDGFGYVYGLEAEAALESQCNADPQLGQVAASVWEAKIGKKPTDNIFTSRAIFYFFGEEGFKEEVDGGRLFERSVEYAENTTHAMQGEMDTIDTTRIDVFDAARFNQKIAAGSVVYSELEKLRAQAANQKFDVLAAKLQNSKNSHIALLNRQAWGLGTGSNDLDGIQKLVSTTPTTGTVGGINAANFSFWRNRQTSGALSVTAFDNARAAYTTVHNLCSLGGVDKKPTAIISDRASFEGFESTMTQLARYGKDDREGDADPSFMNEAFMFKGIPYFYDEDAPSGNAYFLNKEFLKFNFLAGGWMKMYPAVDPSNQLSNVHKLATFANLTVSARRHLGVVSSIS